jgi:hypothetical protein
MENSVNIYLKKERKKTSNEPPILFTVNKLLYPIGLSKSKIAEVKEIVEQEENKKEIVFQGFFVLVVSYFENMITDILTYYLKKVPYKIDCKEFKFTKDEFFNNDLISLQIEKFVHTLSYKPFQEILDCFFKTLSIDSGYRDKYVTELIEIKERRNILIHNNCIVNRIYLEKTGIKDNDRLNKKLLIDKGYLLNSISTIHDFISCIEKSLKEKYSKYTKIKLLKDLWKYIFTSPVLQFDDYWIYNEEKDEVGAMNHPACEDSISHSEKMFLGIWRSHFTFGVKIDGFSIKGLDNENKKKMLFLLSNADEISFY